MVRRPPYDSSPRESPIRFHRKGTKVQAFDILDSKQLGVEAELNVLGRRAMGGKRGHGGEKESALVCLPEASHPGEKRKAGPSTGVDTVAVAPARPLAQ